MKQHIINNLKKAQKSIKKSGNERHPNPHNIWENELIWVEDAIRYLEEKK